MKHIAPVVLAAFLIGACGGSPSASVGQQPTVERTTPEPTLTSTPTTPPTAEPTAEPTPKPVSDEVAALTFAMVIAGSPEFAALASAFREWNVKPDSLTIAAQIVASGDSLLALLDGYEVRPCFSGYRDDLRAFAMAGRDAAQTSLDNGEVDYAAIAAALAPVGAIDLTLSSAQATARCSGDPEPTASPTPAPKVVKITGKGTRNSKTFVLAGGDYDVTVSGKATDRWGGNVIMELALKGGDGFLDNETLTNEIVDRGKYRFETSVNGVEPGTYFVDPEYMPGGSWTVTFDPI